MNKKQENILMVVLGTIIVILILSVVYVKVLKDTDFNIKDLFKGKNYGEMYTPITDLTNEELVNINKKLEVLYLPIYYILDLESSPVITDEDLLLDAANRYHLVWQYMIQDESLKKNFIWDVNAFDEKEKGCANIKEEFVNQYYKTIFNEELKKDIFLADDVSYGINILDGMYFGNYNTDKKQKFVLKATNNMYDEISGEYIVSGHIVGEYSKNGDKTEFNYKGIKKFKDSSVTSWPKSFIYTTFDILYVKNGENNVIKSLIFNDFSDDVIE